MTTRTLDHAVSRADDIEGFLAERALTEQLAAPLSPEDQTVQSMPDASPTKWHRAHTSWFYEQFVLPGDYRVFDDCYAYLFNSYYEGVGPRPPRPERGLVTRPGAAVIGQYREHVEAAVADLIRAGVDDDTAARFELGRHHEQQHQELLVMDAKHLLGGQPVSTTYAVRPADAPCPSAPMTWRSVEAGLTSIGHDGHGFAFDNESPAHDVSLAPFEIAERAVTNDDW